MGESDATIELGVAGEAFFDGGHAHEDDTHVMVVEVVTELFKAGGFQPVGFVDDQQFGASAGAGLGVNKGIDGPVFSKVHGERDLLTSTR